MVARGMWVLVRQEGGRAAGGAVSTSSQHEQEQQEQEQQQQQQDGIWELRLASSGRGLGQ